MNHAVFACLNPEQMEVEICLAEELAQRRGLISELDEMWAYVARKSNPRWLWHAIDHRSGKVLAYGFERRKDEVFLSFDRFRLDHVSISKNESSWFQTLAAMSEGDLEAELKRYQAKHAVPKASGIATRWRREQRDEDMRTAVLYLSMSPDGSLFTNRLQCLSIKLLVPRWKGLGACMPTRPGRMRTQLVVGWQ